MALTDDDRKEMVGLFADAFVDGMTKYQSKLDEDEAKRQADEEAQNKPKGNGSDNGDGDKPAFSLAGFLLGR